MNTRTLLLALTTAIACVSAQTPTTPSFPSVVANPGSLSIGAVCSTTEQCANGAQCYGVSSFTVTTCGSFQSACTSDSQCATNTCNQGFCNGILADTPTSIASFPSVIASPGALAIGAVCSTTEQCANGAQCYGVSAFTVPTCGSFQAVCTSDSQCATNTCNQGFCNGLLSSSATSNLPTSATSNAPTYAPTQSSVMAPADSLMLGAVCSFSLQCANGAQCYGVTADTVTTCGSFQSACTMDNQCATNTCNQGFCNGVLNSSSASVTSSLFTPSLPTVTAQAGTLGLGAICSSSDQCANGADCYGVTAFTVKTCGSFQGACTSDSQCATNTCNSGTCSGFLATTLYRITSASATPTLAPIPSVSAMPGSLKVGDICSTDAQCPSGVQCYGVTSFTVKTCGSFQSACTSDSQCATNTCNQGFCNGVLASSLFQLPSTPTAAGSVATYTGGASKSSFGPGIAVAAAVVAFAL